jgi:hypothetical protein
MVAETRSRQENYTVSVPVERTRTIRTTRYEETPELRKETVTVNVPYTETHEVPVKVCKPVAKEVLVPECGCRPKCCD